MQELLESSDAERIQLKSEIENLRTQSNADSQKNIQSDKLLAEVQAELRIAREELTLSRGRVQELEHAQAKVNGCNRLASGFN